MRTTKEAAIHHSEHAATFFVKQCKDVGIVRIASQHGLCIYHFGIFILNECMEHFIIH